MAVSKAARFYLFGCLVALSVVIAGCDSSDDHSATATGGIKRPGKGTTHGTTHANRNDDSGSSPVVKRPKSHGSGVGRKPSSKTTRNKPPAVRSSGRDSGLTIDKVLQRKDLSARVRERLNVLKTQGRRKITAKYLDSLIVGLDVMKLVDRLLENGSRPTRAKTEPSNEEIVYDTKPTTELEYVLKRIDFFMVGLDHFKSKEMPELSDESKAEAASFIEDVLREIPYRSTTQPWSELLKRGTELQEAHRSLTSEPLYQFCVGLTKGNSNDFSGAARTWKNSFRLFRDSDYPARVAVLPVIDLNWQSSQRLESEEKVAILAEYYIAIEYWMKNDFRAKPEEHRYAFEYIKDFVNYCLREKEYELANRFFKTLTEQIHLPPWIRAVARAHYYGRIAWAYRGTGFVDTVSEEGWAKFEEYQNKAADYLHQAHEMNPLFPEAATQLMVLSRTGHTEEKEEHWFEQATQAHVDFEDALDQRFIGLLPQWGGTMDDMIDFGKKCVKQGEFDTMTPYAMMRCYFEIKDRAYTTNSNREFVLTDRWFVKDVVKALDGLIDSEKAQVLNNKIVGKDYFLTLKAAISSRAKMYDKAREAFEALGDRYNTRALEDLWNLNTSFKVFRASTYARSGESREQAEKLVELWGEGPQERFKNADEIIELSGQMKEEYANTKAETFFVRLNRWMQKEKDYIDGKEISLDFDEDMLLWTFDHAGQIEFKSEDEVSIDNLRSDVNFELSSRVMTPGPKSMEFEIELPTREEKHRSGTHLTPSVPLLKYHGQPFSFGLTRSYQSSTRLPGHIDDTGLLSFGRFQKTRPLSYYEVQVNKGKNLLRVNAGLKHFEVFLNDRFVCRSNGKLIQGVYGNILFGQPKSRKGRGKFNISNVRIKRISNKTPPYDGSAKDLIKFYSDEVASSPEDKWAAYWLAQATHKSGDYEKAIQLYKKANKLGIDKSVSGFYQGDCCEHLGELETAVRWYGYATRPHKEDVTKLYPRPNTNAYSNPNHWAAFRLAWLKRTTTNQKIRDVLNDVSLVRTDLPIHCHWAKVLLAALESANQGRFDEAEVLARRALAKCSADQEDRVLAIAAAFKAGKNFQTPAGEQPLYLLLDDPIPFFRKFEDYLDPSWNGMY